MAPDFTTEELRMIYRVRHRERRDALGWILSQLPLAAFAVYGIAQRDPVAVFVAWAGAACWLAWWSVASGRSTAVLRSVLEKYAAATADAAERAGRGAAA